MHPPPPPLFPPLPQNNLSFARKSVGGGGDEVAYQRRFELALAFSHFTWAHTAGYLLVCDLQGVETTDKRGRRTLLLTDPAIHCPGVLRFGGTNMGMEGVRAFFKGHTCNSHCRALGLRVPDKL